MRSQYGHQDSFGRAVDSYELASAREARQRHIARVGEAPTPTQEAEHDRREAELDERLSREAESEAPQ